MLRIFDLRIVRQFMVMLRFWRAYISIIAPFALLAIPFQTDDPAIQKALWCGYTILLCAVYWVCECLPLAITSLIPVVVLPLAGVISTNEVCKNYLKGTNMMFLAGLIMAVAVEHCGLHKRLALNIIKALGVSRARLMLGFMICSMFLSMWISNTAATAMMVPIVDAIHAATHDNQDIEEDEKGGKRRRNEDEEAAGENSKNILLLACAYASNIGGTGVITGSPPNLVVLSSLTDLLKKTNSTSIGQPMSYATWMAFNVPLMFVNTIMAWGVLLALDNYRSRNCRKATAEDNEKIKNILEKKRRELGSISLHELQVLVLFILLVLLWFFQQPYFITGWADFFKKVPVASATPAVFIVWLLFLLPAKPNLSNPSEALLDWNTVARRLPWGVILLLGGGFALADATEKSGLSALLAATLSRSLSGMGDWQLNLLITFLTTFVTEIASNTACANILVPILMELSIGMCLNPIYMMLAAAICCSYAFMLPIATAPNAIVFSNSSLKTIDMMKIGFVMNILCIFTTNIAINSWGVPLFELGSYPLWADNANPLCLNTTLVSTTTSIPSPLIS